MKIIFLDMDGVLNIMSPTYYSHSYKTLGKDPIEPHLMSRLEFILERIPDAYIVISSSWGMVNSIDGLKKAGFKYVDKIIDSTPRDVEYRGNQINKWLLENDYDSYVVLEDEVFDVCGSKCDVIPINNVIEVNMDEGLSNINVIEAIIILNNLHNNIGVVCEFNKANYDKYYEQGYRAQVSVGDLNDTINYLNLCDKWDTITICNKSLYMILSKSATVYRVKNRLRYVIEDRKKTLRDKYQ